jgi:hypothetical protein
LSTGRNDEDIAEQIAAELHAALKLNASEAGYAHMSRQAAAAHCGKSLEEVLKTCALAALAKVQYPPEDVRAALTLAGK